MYKRHLIKGYLYITQVMFYFIFSPIANGQDQVNDEYKSRADYLIHSIYFGGGSYFIDEQQQKELLNFIKSIENIEHYDVSVHAHTDNIGSKAFNDWLSYQRSQAVVELLIQFSIERETINIKSFGKLNPVYDNDSWTGKLKNRRVDVILWPLAL